MLDNENGGQNDPTSGKTGVVPLIALDPVNLKELYVWLSCAQWALETNKDAIKGEITKLALGMTVSDADVEFTLQRLLGFKGALAELMNEITVEQAKHEMSLIDKDKLN